MSLIVGPVDPSRTFALRQRVLRPTQSIEAVAADSDIEGAISFGASDGENGEILATATVYLEEPPPALIPVVALAATRQAWRLRGVATEENRRSEGLGKLVLDAIVDHIADNRDVVLWCYARLTARNFYDREGFTSFGEIFDVKEIGPHVVMFRAIDRRNGQNLNPRE